MSKNKILGWIGAISTEGKDWITFSKDNLISKPDAQLSEDMQTISVSSIYADQVLGGVLINTTENQTPYTREASIVFSQEGTNEQKSFYVKQSPCDSSYTTNEVESIVLQNKETCYEVGYTGEFMVTVTTKKTYKFCNIPPVTSTFDKQVTLTMSPDFVRGCTGALVGEITIDGFGTYDIEEDAYVCASTGWSGDNEVEYYFNPSYRYICMPSTGGSTTLFWEATRPITGQCIDVNSTVTETGTTVLTFPANMGKHSIIISSSVTIYANEQNIPIDYEICQNSRFDEGCTTKVTNVTVVPSAVTYSDLFLKMKARPSSGVTVYPTDAPCNQGFMVFDGNDNLVTAYTSNQVMNGANRTFAEIFGIKKDVTTPQTFKVVTNGVDEEGNHLEATMKYTKPKLRYKYKSFNGTKPISSVPMSGITIEGMKACNRGIIVDWEEYSGNRILNSGSTVTTIKCDSTQYTLNASVPKNMCASEKDVTVQFEVRPTYTIDGVEVTGTIPCVVKQEGGTFKIPITVTHKRPTTDPSQNYLNGLVIKFMKDGCSPLSVTCRVYNVIANRSIPYSGENSTITVIGGDFDDVCLKDDFKIVGIYAGFGSDSVITQKRGDLVESAYTIYYNEQPVEHSRLFSLMNDLMEGSIRIEVSDASFIPRNVNTFGGGNDGTTFGTTEGDDNYIGNDRT